MKRIIAAVLTLLCLHSAIAQRGPGTVDAFDFGPLPDAAAHGPTCTSPASGVTLRATQTLSPAVRNLVIIIAGQSNITDIAPAAYSPANPTKLDNLNPYDGAVYNAVDPLMGTSCYPNVTVIGNPILRLADTLVTNNKFDRVVLVPLAIGATSVADWDTGQHANRISKALGRLAARGMVAGTNITVIMLWGQGEADAATGTSQAAYTASLNSVIAKSRTAGFAGIWFVAKQSYTGTTTVAAIQNAQAAVVNHGASVWAGADADSLVGSVCAGVACRAADLIHWSTAGSTSYAASWNTALAASGAPF